MVSVVGIVNSALIKIGADTITSLTDDSAEARAANAQYEKLRDEVLRAHPWNFAIARQSLARLAEAPPFGFTWQYQLPSDGLRVLFMNDGRAAFEIEGRRLLTDEGEAHVLYVRRVTDPNEFDAMFREALAYRIAADLAYPLANSTTLAAKVAALLAPLPSRAEQLTTNLAYATAMARIIYLRCPEPLPMADDIAGMGRYWKRHFNGGRGAGSVPAFVLNYSEFVA
jgi:hypothetical protein